MPAAAPGRIPVTFARLLAPCALMLLSGCGDDARTAGGVTRGEADALDKAATDQDAARLAPSAIPAPPGLPLPEGSQRADEGT